MRSVFFICVFLWSGSCPLPFFGRVVFFLGSVWRPRLGEVPPRYNALLAQRGSDPLLCGFFVASVCFGSQGPKSLFVRWGDCCVAPGLSHARFFFPQVFLSLSLSLSLSPA